MNRWTSKGGRKAAGVAALALAGAVVAGAIGLGRAGAQNSASSVEDQTSVPALRDDYIARPAEWQTLQVEDHALVGRVDDRSAVFVRMADADLQLIGAAFVDPEKREVEPIGRPFGIPGRELYPAAVAGDTLIAQSCSNGSEMDACADPTVEAFSLVDGQWSHLPTVGTGKFRLGQWVRTSAAQDSDGSLIVSVSNIDPSGGATRGSASIRLTSDGQTKVVDEVPQYTDQTCNITGEISVLRRDIETNATTISGLVGSPQQPVSLPAGDWTLACDPAIAWSSDQAVQVPSGEKISLPPRYSPAGASAGTVIGVGSDLNQIVLVAAAEQQDVSVVNTGVAFGPTSYLVDGKRNVIAVDVAPPNRSTLPLWIASS